MKTITIQALSLRNFKGCHSLTLDLQGRSASIYGENDAGKSTVYDAFTWLLFGKDHEGNAPGNPNFQIKPLNTGGEVRDHGAETSVEAVLDVSGQSLTLRRTYFELWSRKRGHAEATYDGNSSEFFVDGVPIKKNEFDSRVSELVDEQTFRTLTDVHWFCQKESENNRRAVLFDLIGGVSEQDILSSDPVFEPLIRELAGRGVEDGKKMLTARRKNLNTKRNTIPARLDTCKRTVQEYCDLDFDALRKEREGLVRERDRTQAELDNLRNGGGDQAGESRLEALRANLSALEAENLRYREERSRADQELQTAMRGLERLETDEKMALSEIDWNNQQVESARAEWKQIHREVLTSATCPTCGQSLPPELFREAQSRFEADKRRRQSVCVSRADEYKRRLKNLNSRLEETRAAMGEARRQCEALKQKVMADPVSDLPHYASQRDKLNGEIHALEDHLRKVRSGSSDAISQARTAFLDAEDALRRCDSALAGENVLRNARKIMAELNEEKRLSGQELETVDGLLDLCDRFTIEKTKYIDQKVNGLFRWVKWKLFDQQVNGALKDVCQALIDGVPYGGANSAAKVNAGIDVIQTLSVAKGVRVPLFVDNAESVTKLAESGTQLIRLVVSEGDRTLRLETEGA